MAIVPIDLNRYRGRDHQSFVGGAVHKLREGHENDDIYRRLPDDTSPYLKELRQKINGEDLDSEDTIELVDNS